jgi:prepilin-type N-terminal cleavage/methylation domain-containing protein
MRLRAFTLIEMLVVIAIIGIIAGMVLGLAGMAGRKKRDVVATAAITRLTAVIENYHSKLGFYPPDNAGNLTATAATYDQTTAMNQLLYELTGATYLGNGAYLGFDGVNITTNAVVSAYGRGGIANSNPDEPHVFYYPLPKPTDYAVYPGGTLKGLTVPLQSGPTGTGPYFIHYDSTTPARHNPGSFDVWVEYWAGTDKATGLPLIITNGNW